MLSPENIDAGCLPENIAVAMIQGGGGHTAVITGVIFHSLAQFRFAVFA